MQREILFRGQNIRGQWHYGLLSHNNEIDSDYEWFISNSAGKPFAFGAIEKTIGQFTGLTEKNGNRIFEGDILQSESWGKNSKSKNPYHLVVYGKVEWLARGYNGDVQVSPKLDVRVDWKIIGNIHEHPELLNTK